MTTSGSGYHAPRSFASVGIGLTNNVVATVMALQSTYYPVQSGGWNENVVPTGAETDLVGGVITVTEKGRYFISGSISFTGAAAIQAIEFQIFKNGAEEVNNTASSGSLALFPNTVTMQGLADLEAGDTIDLRAQCTSAAGVSLTVVDCDISVFLVG